MKNATKKWLIVAGGLAACAALVFIIAGQFEKKPVNDTLPPPSCSSQGGVMVDEPDSSISPEKDDPEITGQGGLRPLWRKDGAGYQIPWPPTLAV